MITFRMMKTAAFVGATLTLALLTGCGGKAEEPASTPANTTGGPEMAKTSSQMPPEVKARMDQTQEEMKARADAQGKAMMQNNTLNGKK